jgi:hypothetical protein
MFSAAPFATSGKSLIASRKVTGCLLVAFGFSTLIRSRDPTAKNLDLFCGTP